MPKQVTMYECNICGNKHEDIENAQGCEKTHKKVEKIAKMEYKMYANLPDKIYIEFKEGYKGIYQRCG